MNKYLLVLIGIFLISFVGAVPSPHAFYGTIRYSDGDHVYGTIIAERNDIEVGSSDITNGNYELIVSSESGGIIYFYLDGKEEPLANYTFEAFGITELNLVIEIDEEDDDDESDSKPTLLKQYCEPSWSCGKWGLCDNGLMTRKCYDKNYCKSSQNKPNEVAGCEIRGKSLVTEDYVYAGIFFSFLTLMALIVLLVVVIRR